MFAVIYKERIQRRFAKLTSAYRYLIAQGWEWDDRAVIKRLTT